MAGEVFYSKMAPVFSVQQEDTGNLFSAFYKIFKSQAFSDIMIKSQSKTFKVHRAVLVAQSTYFSSLLLNDDGNEKIPPASHVTLDINPDTLQLILDFIYSGRLTNIPNDDAKSLREAAEQLGIKAIVNKCKKVELSNTKPTAENCMEGWKSAMELEDDDLHEKFSQLALTQFSEITASPSFVNLDLDIIKDYLGHRDLEVKRPDLIIYSALNWVRADLAKRLPHLPVLLKSLPLDNMSTAVLSCLLDAEPVFREQVESRAILQEAVNQSEVRPAKTVIEATAKHIIVFWGVEKAIKLYDASLQKETRSIAAHPDINNIGFTGCCVVGDDLFVCGEYSLYTYNLTSNQWQVREPLKYSRLLPGLVTTNNRVFIFGGFHNKAVTDVEVWDTTTESLMKAGKLLGDRCPCASCCLINDTDIAVWGMKDADVLILQVYSITENKVTHSVRVENAAAGQGVVKAGSHIVMCDNTNSYACRISELYKDSSNCVRKLKNFRPKSGRFDALLVSADGEQIFTLCQDQRIFSANVKDVISDAQKGWSVVDIKWPQNEDEWCYPGAVCTSYGTK